MNKRIDVIDGWRTIAALGVLYGHVLGTLNIPSVQNIDIIRVLNLWGNGVQLFFVISGFCFFLVLDKQKDYSFAASLSFWKKRWLRIAPAFYTACLVYAYINYDGIKTHAFKALAANFLFIQTYVPGTEISAHFWSLSVEWLFYLSLPLIFYFIRRKGYVIVIAAMFAIGLLLNLLHYKWGLYNGFDWYYTFFANFEHFACGLLVGYLFKTGKLSLGIFNKVYGIIIGFVIAYIGKIFFYSFFVKRMGRWGFVFESIGPLVMTLGFAWMILVSLRNDLVFKLIGNKLFTFIGRISYSFYLWHVLLLGCIYSCTINLFPQNGLGILCLFTTTAVVLLPISYLSYKLLEEFYFKRSVK
jgi:peptidoglycan/LPS O-acetylase OafA/YrhL